MTDPPKSPALSVPDPERIDVAQEMLSAAKLIKDQIFLPGEFTEVAPLLPEALLRDAIAFAQRISDAGRSARTLAALLPWLAGFGHPEEAFGLALTTPGSERSHEGSRLSDTLSTLIPRLTGSLQRSACELPHHLLQDALAVARDMPLEERGFGTVLSSPRADALLALVPRLPESMHSEVLREVVAAINCIEDSMERTRASAQVARLQPEPPELPEDIRQEAIKRAAVLRPSSGRPAGGLGRQRLALDQLL